MKVYEKSKKYIMDLQNEKVKNFKYSNDFL